MSQPGRPVGVSIHQERITITHSPFLAAEELQKIELVVPGGADRALRLVEKQADHRIKQENRVIVSNIVGERLGQLIGAAIALGGLYAGYQLILAGKGTEGFFAMFAPLAILAGIFVVGRAKRDRELGSRDVHRQ